MFPRWFCFAIGLSVLVTLLFVARVLPWRGSETKNGEARIVPGERGIEKPGRTKPEEGREQKRISDEEKLVLASRAMRNVQFPSNPAEAEKKLGDDIKFLLSLPPSSERTLLMPALAEAYAKAVFESCSSKEGLLDRMRGFESVVRSSASGDYVERMLVAATARCAEMIKGLPEGQADSYLSYVEGQTGVDSDQMGSRIIASGYVAKLKTTKDPDLSVLDSIEDPAVRMLAERTFLRTYGFAYSEPKVVATFASRYLAADSLMDPDPEVAIRLFGVGLERHPEEISSVILNAPPGPKKDGAIEMMVSRIAQSDPERADLWFEMIQDPDIKKRTGVIMERKRRDPPPKPQEPADPSKNPFR